MRDYNGFSGAERMAAHRWLTVEWESGRLARPSLCCACGQDRGIIDAHAEVYSRPFTAEKLQAFELCYICHLMLHCRFGKGRAAWDRYRSVIAGGGRYAPTHVRDFGIIQTLLNGGARVLTYHERPAWAVLDEITDGKHRPAGLLEDRAPRLFH